MLRPALIAMLIAGGPVLASCGFQPAAPPAPPEDSCADSDGPSPDTVRRAIAAVPPIDSSAWTETARGHTGNCRLYWVKLSLHDATAASPEQLLFFDHDAPLGSPTPPKPYTTVVASSRDTVIVQYQWRVGDDPPCCPTGGRTTRYQIGPDGHLTTASRRKSTRQPQF